ncbi:MAG: DAK2 domain-containing protein, partial [Lachnospiraceae bacterium]|nr:DAK2 domain-containing protein [Lachnospiraceae bacterium]
EVQAEAEIKYGYCTEFLILLNKNFNIKTEMDFKAYLESIGDSIVCVCDGETVKIHVHTNDPGLALQKGLKFGQLSNIKIDNMRLEQEEKLAKAAKKAETEAASAPEKTSEPPKKVGFIAISAGEGLSEIFKSIGVDYVIEGGQTMNPSTADILDAVDQVNAENIFVLPNNKNIILAARQAAELMTDKNLLVIPTKTIPQGITAVINYMDGSSVDENEEVMISEISKVKTGQITYAIRDTVIDDKEIKKDDYMGVGDDGILANGTDLTEVVMNTVAAMADADSELISVYYGADVSEEDAEAIRTKIADAYPNLDVELQNGGQPIYYYLISVE